MNGNIVHKITKGIQSGEDLISLTRRFWWEDVRNVLFFSVPERYHGKIAETYLLSHYGPNAVEVAKSLIPEVLDATPDATYRDPLSDRVPAHRRNHLRPSTEKGLDFRHSGDKMRSNQRQYNRWCAGRPNPHAATESEYPLYLEGFETFGALTYNKQFASEVREVVDTVVLPEDSATVAHSVYLQGMDMFARRHIFPTKSQIEELAIQFYDSMFMEQRTAIPLSMSSNTEPRPFSNTLYATSTAPLPGLSRVGESPLVPAFNQDHLHIRDD